MIGQHITLRHKTYSPEKDITATVHTDWRTTDWRTTYCELGIKRGLSINCGLSFKLVVKGIKSLQKYHFLIIFSALSDECLLFILIITTQARLLPRHIKVIPQ